MNSSENAARNVENLDPLTFPLFGHRLIEASAGTGKTYTLTNLYLRLILRHGSLDSAHQNPLTVDQILMVTFTRAATAELKERIREKIHQARLAIEQDNKTTQDRVISELVTHYSNHDKSTAVERLQRAEQQIDQAAIYTIHGFCKRALEQHAFESNQLFEFDFIEDSYDLVSEVTADFWRHHFYPASEAVAQHIYSCFKSPDELFQIVSHYYNKPKITVLPHPIESMERLFERIEQQTIRVLRLKKDWLNHVDEITDLISSDALHGGVYGKKVNALISDMTAWAQHETTHTINPELIKKFSTEFLITKTKQKKTTPTHSVFEQCQSLLDNQPNVKTVILANAIAEIQNRLITYKQQKNLIDNDDLLTKLEYALTQSPNKDALIAALKSQYPVAMIDEFQDTDDVQYTIFSSIYSLNLSSDKKQNHQIAHRDFGLFFIGDPKQAIYAFRGADIFTYIKAKRATPSHFTLDTNWRSSEKMIEAVNTLFRQSKNPFIYNDAIPFDPIKPSPKASSQFMVLNERVYPAMEIWYQATPLKSEDYLTVMAEATVAKIDQLIRHGQKQHCLLNFESGNCPLDLSDICILVRNKVQANIIKNALNAHKIPSVFLSERGSVFCSQEAHDLLFLLNACLHPDQRRILRSALAVRLLDKTATDLEALNENEALWEQSVQQFYNYRQIWLRDGVQAMLRTCAHDFDLAEKSLQYDDGERQLTNFFHLSEILGNKANELDGHYALLHWFKHTIQIQQESNTINDEQCLRLESDENKVQIVTVHKSKGLEYSLVFLPFAATSVKKDTMPLFHNEADCNWNLHLEPDEETLFLALQEKRAEELRLLYVALTRSIYGCFIGLMKPKDDQKMRETPFALYDLLANDVGFDHAVTSLEQHCDGITVTAPPRKTTSNLTLTNKDTATLKEKTFNKTISHNYQITSYSHLSQQQSHVYNLAAHPPLDTTNLDDDNSNSEDLSIFNFEKGAKAGTLLHELFESISFNDLDLEALHELTLQKLESRGIDSKWAPTLVKTIQNVTQAKLFDHFSLNLLPPEKCLIEMEFFFPIKKINAKKINEIVRQFDPLSKQASLLDFKDSEGMLKGFIDLTFEFNNQFYVLDYKSNFLGYNVENYNIDATKQAMIAHRYDFQYQVYTIALHRLLKLRLPNYNYSKHFGGVIYLFIRGITANDKEKHGIFFSKPKQEMIEMLDRCIS